MAEEPKRKRQRITEYPSLYIAARTPMPPRVECAVFGCRNTDADPSISFYPFPEDPDRWSEWLRLINRRDLAGALSAGACAARVCGAHFSRARPTTPALLLPTRGRVQYVRPGPSELAVEVDLEPLVKTEEDYEEQDTIEIEFEPEAPPTCTYQTKPPEQTTTVPKKTRIRKPIAKKGPTLEIDCGVLKNQSVQLESIYDEFEGNVGAQTDCIEALYRRATFSVLESIDIPPTTAHRIDDILNRSIQVETTPELLEYFTVSLLRQLGDNLKEAKRKLSEAEKVPMEKHAFVKNCEKYLNEKIGAFVKSHAYLNNKFPDDKYPPGFKSFALNLYLLNPQSYKFVEQFFDLPSKDRIQRFHIPIRTGLNPGLLASLKVKMDQMSVVGKMCVVSFDVMRLTKKLYYDITNDYLCGFQEIDEVIGPEPAEYAAVVMVRGLYNRWKQPISFALLSEKRQHPELKDWILKIITTLFSVSCLVKALVLNMDDEFLDVSIDESTVYIEVDGRPVYQLYDVPNLFKSARDAFMEYDFYIKNTVAKWDDVINVYNFDKQQEYRLMPNITEEHIAPSPECRDDIKLATQVFSKSVAAAMQFHVVAKLLPKRTKETVDFLKRMSNLYEILYSRTLANAYRATTAQNRFLKETVEWLQSIEVKDIYGNVIDCKFLSGLIVSIKSIQLLKAHLKKCNVHYLLTKNLSQDCLRTYFKDVERFQKSECPTPIMFVRAFRRLFLVNLLKNTKKGAEENDVMKTLVKISEYVKEDLANPEKPHRDSLAVGVTDYHISWPSTEYIAGYLLWKCLEYHPCKLLIQNLCEHYNFDDQTDADLLLHAFQCYNGDNITGSYLTKPPKSIVDFVIHMENKYDEYMSKNLTQNANFGHNIYMMMENDSFNMPCQCFSIKYMKMLYIRLRIYSSVKMYNKLKFKDTAIQNVQEYLKVSHVTKFR